MQELREHCSQVAPANSLMPEKVAALRPVPRSLLRDRSGRRAGHQADRCSARRRRCASASGRPAAVRAPLLASGVRGAREQHSDATRDSSTSVWLSPDGTSPPCVGKCLPGDLQQRQAGTLASKTGALVPSTCRGLPVRWSGCSPLSALHRECPRSL